MHKCRESKTWCLTRSSPDLGFLQHFHSDLGVEGYVRDPHIEESVFDLAINDLIAHQSNGRRSAQNWDSISHEFLCIFAGLVLVRGCNKAAEWPTVHYFHLANQLWEQVRDLWPDITASLTADLVNSLQSFSVVFLELLWCQCVVKYQCAALADRICEIKKDTLLSFKCIWK